MESRLNNETTNQLSTSAKNAASSICILQFADKIQVWSDFYMFQNIFVLSKHGTGQLQTSQGCFVGFSPCGQHCLKFGRLNLGDCEAKPARSVLIWIM
jgi:hypothetical protein